MNQSVDVCNILCTAIEIVSMNDVDDVTANTVELASSIAILVTIAVLTARVVEAISSNAWT